MLLGMLIALLLLLDHLLALTLALCMMIVLLQLLLLKVLNGKATLAAGLNDATLAQVLVIVVAACCVGFECVVTAAMSALKLGSGSMLVFITPICLRLAGPSSYFW